MECHRGTLLYSYTNLLIYMKSSIEKYTSVFSSFFSFHVQEYVLMTEGYENNRRKVKPHPTLCSPREPEVLDVCLHPVGEEAKCLILAAK